jgi:hypothetical protein
VFQKGFDFRKVVKLSSGTRFYFSQETTSRGKIQKQPPHFFMRPKYRKI